MFRSWYDEEELSQPFRSILFEIQDRNAHPAGLARPKNIATRKPSPPEHTIAPCKPHHPAKHAFSTQQHTPYSDDNDGNRRRLSACVPRGQRRLQRGGSAATTRRRREQWRQRHAHGAARAAANAKRAKVPNLCTHCWECQVSDIFIRAESRVRLRVAYLASCPAHTEWAVAGGGRPPPNSLTALGCTHRVGTAESRTWHE